MAKAYLNALFSIKDGELAIVRVEVCDVPGSSLPGEEVSNFWTTVMEVQADTQAAARLLALEDLCRAAKKLPGYYYLAQRTVPMTVNPHSSPSDPESHEFLLV